MAKQGIYRQLRNDLNRRARLAGSEGELSYADLYAVAEYYGYHCLVPDCANEDYQFDHVIPLEMKGANRRSNLQLLCESHNKSRQAIDYRPQDKPFCPDDYVSQDYEEKDGRIKHNWDEIESDYVYGDETLREIEKRYKVAHSQISIAAADGDWVRKRKNYRDRIGTEIAKEIEAKNIADGFSAYKAFALSMRRAFDDYMAFPDPDKLRALHDLLEDGLVMEDHEIKRQTIAFKGWQKEAEQIGENATDIHEYATSAAATYYSGGDSGGDTEGGAGWTD